MSKHICREQILSRAQELTETKVVLELYPMIHQDQTFDMSFWSGVLQQTEDDMWEYEGSQVPYRLNVSIHACQILACCCLLTLCIKHMQDMHAAILTLWPNAGECRTKQLAQYHNLHSTTGCKVPSKQALTVLCGIGPTMLL